MRERATEAPVPAGPWESEFSDVIRTDVAFGGPGYLVAETGSVAEARHIASWHPVVALAVAKAMDDVAHAWEIADEAADGYVYDADDNHYRFEETVDGGWLNVARAYLGRAS